MKVFKYNSSGSWEEVTATLGYKYVPKSSSAAINGTIVPVTGATGGYTDAGALFSAQPNTQYKIIFNANITSATFNPSSTVGVNPIYWIAVGKSTSSTATTVDVSITRQLVNGKTEITVTTPADTNRMIFNFSNNRGSSSNRADVYFSTRFEGVTGFISGWSSLPVKERANGSWTDGEVYISTANVWIN